MGHGDAFYPGTKQTSLYDLCRGSLNEKRKIPIIKLITSNYKAPSESV